MQFYRMLCGSSYTNDTGVFSSVIQSKC